jgi:hypothetical protein
MSASFRWRGRLTRADTRDLDEVFSFDTHATYANFMDRDLTIAASGSFTLAGFTTIQDVALDSDGTTVDVQFTNGSGSWTMESTGVLVMQDVVLTGFVVTNKSATTTVKVRLVAAGT